MTDDSLHESGAEPDAPTAPPRTLTLGSAEDLLAAVTVILGFSPAESLVQLSLSARDRAPHVRIDLPEGTEVRRHASPVIDAALQYGVSEVALGVYCSDPERGRVLAERFAQAYAEAGIDPRIILWCTPDRYFVPQGMHGGVAYDTSDHGFVADTVRRGGAVLPDRETLAASLAPVAADQLAEVIRSMPPAAERLGPDEAVAVMAGLARSRPPRDLIELARLIEAFQRVEVREAWCVAMTRTTAHRHLEVMAEVVRHAPRGMRATPAAVMAFMGWLSGNGALAWCALDESEADGGCELAEMIAQCLESALSPDCWHPFSGPDGGVCA